MARKIKKALLSTVIIVGEGVHEKAFLSYLKELYSFNTGQKVKIDLAVRLTAKNCTPKIY